MKMIIAIVHDSDSANLITVLIENRFQVTKLATSGGFLKEGNTTIMVGADEERVEELLSFIKDNSKSRDQLVSPISPMGNSEAFVTFPIEVRVGGATVFVLPVDHFYKF